MFVLFQALFNEADYTVTINQHHLKTSRFHEVAPWKRCDNILFNILTKTETSNLWHYQYSRSYFYQLNNKNWSVNLVHRQKTTKVC